MTAANPDLQVIIMPPHWGLPSISPFGLKLATWVRVAGLRHELRFESDPRKGPKRKSPWIVDAGTALGDSELVIAHLSRTRELDLEAGLGARERAIGLLLRRTFEEHFHQVIELGMWVLDEGWEHAQEHFDFLPALPRPLLKKVIRSSCRKEALIRGVARHSLEDVAAMAADDIRAASTLLGDQDYLFGTHPTTTDCTLFAFLTHALGVPYRYFAQDEVKRHANLVEYCERMRARYFPDPPSEGPWSPPGSNTDAITSARSSVGSVREQLVSR